MSTLGEFAGFITIDAAPINGGTQTKYRFGNERGASVLRGGSRYGGYEVAVLDANGNLDYSTPITDDVVGHIASDDDCAGVLAQIAALPEVAG